MINKESINYWKTQIVLKRKIILNHLPFGKSDLFERFVVLCDPRTGSTWLHTLLNSSPDIMSYGEILTEKDMSDGLVKTIWSPHHHSIRAVGCKLFYEQLLLPEFEHILNEIQNNGKVKIIDLYREEKLETYVSLKIAEQSNIWSKDNGLIDQKERLNIDLQEFERYVDDQSNSRKKVLDRLNHLSSHVVSYEELVRSPTYELKRIQSFINSKPRQLFSLLKKQNPEPLEDLISNFDEIKELMQPKLLANRRSDQ